MDKPEKSESVSLYANTKVENIESDPSFKVAAKMENLLTIEMDEGFETVN